jgi:hypothetical protein
VLRQQINPPVEGPFYVIACRCRDALQCSSVVVDTAIAAEGSELLLDEKQWFKPLVPRDRNYRQLSFAERALQHAELKLLRLATQSLRKRSWCDRG